MSRSPREGMPPDAVNLHASTIVLGDRGVLIRGASGTGKTHLALTLVARWSQANDFARLVCDDQTFVMPRNGRLIARAPLTIAGLAEVSGAGIVDVAHEPAAVVDLVVELVDAPPPDAFEPSAKTLIQGVELPLLRLPAHNVEPSSMAIAAAFGGFPPHRQRHSAAIMLAIEND
jgi:serine kinase of HPr protein (carbohydrate metabolism regulator)